MEPPQLLRLWSQKTGMLKRSLFLSFFVKRGATCDRLSRFAAAPARSKFSRSPILTGTRSFSVRSTYTCPCLPPAVWFASLLLWANRDGSLLPVLSPTSVMSVADAHSLYAWWCAVQVLRGVLRFEGEKFIFSGQDFCFYYMFKMKIIKYK